MANISMRDLLEAGVHFGHRTRYWSPKMKPYIFGERDKIHIINLEKTLPMLAEATNYLGSVIAGGGKVLFVATKRQASATVREQALRCHSPYVDHRWLGGMLTNYKTVKNSISRLNELEQVLDSAIDAGMSKKESLNLSRDRFKLDRALRGIKNMDGLPAAIFVIDIQQEAIAVREAKKLGIAVVAVVDTNCSPDLVDYIIPGNDDSGAAIRLYLTAVADAINDARTAAGLPIPGSEAAEEAEQEVVKRSDGAPTKVKVTVKKSHTKAMEKPATDKPPTESPATAKPATAKPPTEKDGAQKKVAKKPAANKAAKKKVAKKVTKKKVAKKKVTKKKTAE